MWHLVGFYSSSVSVCSVCHLREWQK